MTAFLEKVKRLLARIAGGARSAISFVRATRARSAERTEGTEGSGSAEERYYVATQWQLMWRKLRRHKLAMVGLVILVTVYGMALFSGFLGTSDVQKRHTGFIYCPAQRIHFFEADWRVHLRPFVYAWKKSRDPVTRELIYEEDTERLFPIRLFVRRHPYRFVGLIPARVHLLGVDEPGHLFLFGTDKLGRDLYSRTLAAARVSLSIGLVGIAVSFVLGCALGGVSGYYGGRIDTFIQRLIEFLLSVPTLPLWMALAAAVPKEWPPLKVYLTITILLSIVGWCGLARVVRGKLISLREEDYVLAARIAGATDGRIIRRHLLPAFLSYLIVSLTLAVPRMILGETALSFLGLGLRPPVVSWGVLLSTAQDVKVVTMYPWILIPGVFVVLTVLALNFLGDGLRDAADPYH